MFRRDPHFAATFRNRRFRCLCVKGQASADLGKMVADKFPGARIAWGVDDTRSMHLAQIMLFCVEHEYGGDWLHLNTRLKNELADFGATWTLGLATLWMWCVAGGRHPLAHTPSVN